jgi:hypothetical protein
LQDKSEVIRDRLIDSTKQLYECMRMACRRYAKDYYQILLDYQKILPPPFKRDYTSDIMGT